MGTSQLPKFVAVEKIRELLTGSFCFLLLLLRSCFGISLYGWIILKGINFRFDIKRDLMEISNDYVEWSVQTEVKMQWWVFA